MNFNLAYKLALLMKFSCCSDSVHAFMRKWEPATTTENPKMKKLEEQELQRKRQPTYTVEYGEAVDFGDFVRQQ